MLGTLVQGTGITAPLHTLGVGIATDRPGHECNILGEQAVET